MRTWNRVSEMIEGLEVKLKLAKYSMARGGWGVFTKCNGLVVKQNSIVNRPKLKFEALLFLATHLSSKWNAPGVFYGQLLFLRCGQYFHNVLIWRISFYNDQFVNSKNPRSTYPKWPQVLRKKSLTCSMKSIAVAVPLVCISSLAVLVIVLVLFKPWYQLRWEGLRWVPCNVVSGAERFKLANYASGQICDSLV